MARTWARGIACSQSDCARTGSSAPSRAPMRVATRATAPPDPAEMVAAVYSARRQRPADLCLCRHHLGHRSRPSYLAVRPDGRRLLRRALRNRIQRSLQGPLSGRAAVDQSASLMRLWLLLRRAGSQHRLPMHVLFLVVRLRLAPRDAAATTITWTIATIGLAVLFSC